MSSKTAAGIELRRLYAAGVLHAEADDAVVARAAALVEEAGGRTWTRDESRRRLAQACEALAEVDLDPAARDSLIQIAQYVTARDH
jgi:geranylgeranyl diphosphate synthase type I